MTDEEGTDREPDWQQAYRPSVWKKDGVFFLHEKRFSILVSGENLQDVHNRYLDELNRRVEVFRDAGYRDLLPDVREATQGRGQGGPSVARELTLFAAKSAMVAALIALVSYVVLFQAESIASQKMESAFAFAKSRVDAQMGALPDRVRNLLAQFAARISDMTPEGRAALARDIETLADVLRPLYGDADATASATEVQPAPKAAGTD